MTADAELAGYLDAMTPRERRLVRDAAVMGYVRGNMAGKCGDFTIPPDVEILHEVVDACLAFPDLYPVTNAAANGWVMPAVDEDEEEQR
jgi:hypothetical protein